MRWTAALPLLLSLSVLPAWAQPRPRAESALPLEVAPGAIGTSRSEKGLLLAADGPGKQIYLFDKQTGSLSVYYLENGDLWKKPLTLRDLQGQSFRNPCFRMDARGDWLAFSCTNAVALFKPDGSLARQSDSFFLTSDVAAMPGGAWAVGLLQVPEGDGRFLGTKEKGSQVPRLVQVDRELEITGRGLAVGGDERTPNQAAARALMLAAGGQRVFAAEIANYKVYELDRRLKLRATYEEPDLQLEQGRPGDSPDPRKDEKLRESTAKWLEAKQGNAAAAPEKPAVEGGSRQYVPVLQDIAWDPVSSRLVLLLSHTATKPGDAALDFFDPETGEVERFSLRFPKGATPDMDLTQIAIGHRFLWLRAHKGSSPTFRIDRFVLDQAKPSRQFRLKSDVEEAGSGGR